MSNPLCFDTRFFFEIFTSTNDETINKLREIERNCPERHISVITLHEVAHQIVSLKGVTFSNIVIKQIQAKYKVHFVDAEIALKSAEFRVGHQIPMADSIIATTALRLNIAVCTDDPHFKTIPKSRTVWLK